MESRTNGAATIRRLRRTDLPIDTIELARFLIGKMLVHDFRGPRTSGRIVETEAYPAGDPAGHAFRGKTVRNSPLYLARGHAYVYFVYGMYYCLNVSSERLGIGAGVLVSALEPFEGIDCMKERRSSSSVPDLARGPGRLAIAIAIRFALQRGGLVHGSFVVARRVRFRIPRRCVGANRLEPRAKPALALLRARQHLRKRSALAGLGPSSAAQGSAPRAVGVFNHL